MIRNAYGIGMVATDAGPTLDDEHGTFAVAVDCASRNGHLTLDLLPGRRIVAAHGPHFDEYDGSGYHCAARDRVERDDA